MRSQKLKAIWEFGDFQTPEDLANQTIKKLKDLSFTPQSILEPTCGLGSFLLAAKQEFAYINNLIGVEINIAHLEKLFNRIKIENLESYIEVIHADFFTLNWSSILNKISDPVFIIGNPPWVTSAELGRLQSLNLPSKTNFKGWSGLDALTGKSNFDISEWMIFKYLEWLKNRTGAIGVLCKTAVARKVLIHAWKHKYPVQLARIYAINAQKYFNAAVDACFFVMEIGFKAPTKECIIFNNLTDINPSHTIGYRDKIVVNDVFVYDKLRYLLGIDEVYTWRSGIKHDCAKIMELERREQSYINGNGDTFHLEDTYVYPLLKSSDINSGKVSSCRKYILVTQKYVGEDTFHIQTNAPHTWDYLQDHIVSFVKRSSSIYKNRPPFSIFGVGEYSFAPWKVAISGFYKNLKFQVVGFINEKPVIVDDTVYFLACQSEEEAIFIAMLLNSSIAQDFLTSMIFWNDKRPITTELLKRLDLRLLSRTLGLEEQYLEYAKSRKTNKESHLNQFITSSQIDASIKKSRL